MNYLAIAEKWINKGVVIIDKNHTYIDDLTEIGQGTIIYPGCFIINSKIGENNKITINSWIENSKIGNDNSLEQVKIVDCSIGDRNQIGPFAHLRNQVEISDECRVGNFVEVKKSKVDQKTKLPHLSYIGDAKIGKRVNVGCGSITVNYNGFKKFSTVIGDDCFIGCNSNLIAPISLGNKVVVAAGTTVNQDVGDGKLVINRAELKIKNDYYTKHHLRKGEK